MPQNRHSALREGLFLMIFEVFLLPIAERKLKPFWMARCLTAKCYFGLEPLGLRCLTI